MKQFRKILLIDDNEMVNFYNEDVATETGLFEEIVIITTGEEAMEYFRSAINKREDLPELVFLDIKMPDYDGFEILEDIENQMIDLEESEDAGYLKKVRKMIICMLTTSTHKRDLELFNKFPVAVEYLEKPLTVEKINEIADRYLRK